VPEKWKNYTALNKTEYTKFPTLSTKKDPLPTAKTLEQIKAAGG
jgi:hypothetical protein